ncbi:MTHFR-domain-containing protein [Exidia glandulosa HHB12029]|uniref:MTHFR-domain-containing protein n=1 Tax=Exidia glandulosa HHB12029 TaxID=1314781 RepID=A0A165EPC3_EXIGL|nr:MTHFR-domain-containing protein [Exidia glandulosa HHB12029]
MKLTDKINNRLRSTPYYTLEFFPPKTEQGFANLLTRIHRLSQFQPLAVSITWGAGGSTKDRSLELASICQSEHGTETILHLTCTNVESGTVQSVLKAAKDAGIQNILALRGDPPRGAEYWIPTDPQFNHASDLVAAIRSSPEFSQHFCVGVAAYPDGHPDQEVDEERELANLKRKVDAGADFIVTQLFYDVDAFFAWERKVRAKGITVPIIPGIMPIQNYPSFLRVVKLTGSKVPDAVHKALEPIRHDDAKVKDYGVMLATSMVQRLTNSGVVKGVHFCTLNLELSVRKVLERLQWTVSSPIPPVNKLIDDSTQAASKSEPEAHLLITPESAVGHLTVHPPSDTTNVGKGELNDPSTWDEYPNGRFGDAKSPAYGGVEPWDSTLASSHAEAIAKWGNPKTEADLTALFLAHLNGHINGTPFWESPLSPESRLILPHLRRMTARGWWTVGSQPAADAVRSDDPILGWGPVNGYVFQKAFVEFFASREDVDWLERSAKTKSGGLVTYFAGNAEGEWATNMLDESGNAVTWGVFPGQEIAQSTIIERDSFLAWKEEAFRIWAEWSQFYPPESPERTLLEQMRQERWLISIVHHDFKDPNGLWHFWLDGRESSNGSDS